MAYLTWDEKASKPKIDFFAADGYKGKDLYEVFPKVFKRFGMTASVAGCGVAGEYGYANSGIVFNDLAKRRVGIPDEGGWGQSWRAKGSNSS